MVQHKKTTNCGNRDMFSFVVFLFVIFEILCAAPAVYATDYSSTNYTVSNPVLLDATSTFMSSNNFQLLGNLGQAAIGKSSITDFALAAGFLYFPVVTSPVVSATAGDGQVSLSWSASSASLGWSVGGYNVGQSTVSGGPYTFSSSLGNVTSSTRTGLTNGTTYYFIVRTEDAFGNVIATSSQVSAAPASSGGGGGGSTPSPPSTPAGGGAGGGGGGGGGILYTAPNPTRIILKGRAYPGAAITILQDASVVATPQADSNGLFHYEKDVEGGIYTFSLYALDNDNRKSLTFSFTISIQKNFTTTIPDIVLAPTIEADKSQVKAGNDIKFFGYAYPQSQINVIVNSDNPMTEKTSSDKLGFWSYDLDSSVLEQGGHVAKSQTVTPDSVFSPFSESLAFTVGTKDIPFGKSNVVARSTGQEAAQAAARKGDLNNDGKTNIVDFSILLYYWNQRNPKNSFADINGDGIVNIFDFSIMLYWWTG